MTKWFAVASLMLAACSGGASDEAATPAPVALVTIAAAQQGALTDRVTLYGVAEAGAGGKVALTAPTEAIVVRIVTPVGTRVTAGQVVAQLGAAPNTRLDIVKASTDARAADAAYARAQRLRKDGLVGNAEVETARAAAQSADATRASLAGRAGALTLRARTAGFVESVAVSDGDLIQPGATVATIARNGDLRAHFGVDPSVARALHPGAPIRIEASTGRAAFAVPIASVSPIIDPTTRQAAVFATLPAAAGLGVGEVLTGTVAVGASGGGIAVTIPYAALLDDGGQPYVYVVTSGVAHRHNVSPGATEGDRVAITQGVKPGDHVVVEGGTAVDDGMKVRTK
ncbi:efflux RND transporter periplasmic adaptor subunit [Sphingomonas oligophenolica]|uniref:Efflux RND transporter periplasmic adaptor subunit n=1 Tax=Sphingomonas oligophenolica TaxID=301154 RepID=A0A502CNH4_9SPHN|nr:efflux RND transporter periplasmic adaptor subunit [Sphingomonas oligophenolica]TPG14312.1 efflux RND transporter periplasmic adaptor subunit [Sphingomonas oligophenolica]